MKKIIACVLVAFNSVCCIVIETPQNEIVFVGQTMSFKCRTTNGDIVREWRFSNRSSDSNQIKIFSNWNTSPPKSNFDRYNVDVNEFGSGALLANNTQLEDAGTYTCLVENDTGQPIPYSAELIVLESDLKCDSFADDNNLSTGAKRENKEIWCNVSYAGDLIPVVTWYGNDRKVTLPTESELRVGKRKWFYFNTTFLVNSSDNGMVFSCEIHFKPSNTNEAISNTRRATNMPARKFTGCIFDDSRNISTEPDALDYSSDSVGWKSIVLSLVVAVLALSAGVALVCVTRSKGLTLSKCMNLCGKDRNREDNDAEETEMVNSTTAKSSNAAEALAPAAVPTIPTDSGDETLPAIEFSNTEVYSNLVGIRSPPTPPIYTNLEHFAPTPDDSGYFRKSSSEFYKDYVNG